MPPTLQPVIVTPSMPLVLAFYKALFGAVEISRVPEDGPAFYVGLQIGNAELGVVADGDARIDAPQRILLNVNVGDLDVGDVDGLLEHVEALGGRVLGPPNDMPWGSEWPTSRIQMATPSISPSPSDPADVYPALPTFGRTKWQIFDFASLKMSVVASNIE
jgi:predicted enzyme related to lactoylglutathione lyase